MARYRLHHSLGRRRVIRTLWLEFKGTWGSSSTWTTTGWHSGQTVRGCSWQHALTEVNVGTIAAEGGLPWYGDSPAFELPPRWFQ